MSRAAFGLVVVAALVCAACGGDDEPEALVVVPDTVALGELPDPIAPANQGVAPPTTAPPPVATSVPEEIDPIDGPIGDVVEGDRVLLIGDSAMTTLTERYEGVGCQVLNELGWDVEIEAEAARYLPFADEVIGELVVDQGEGWDVVGLMFGHFLDTSVDEFGAEVERIVDELSPRPILLYTVTQDGDETATEINEVLRAIGEATPNVVVVDWGAAVAFEQIVDLTDDSGLPNREGMGRIVLLTAAALGDAPGGGMGLCLEPRYTDDSAIVIQS